MLTKIGQRSLFQGKSVDRERFCIVHVSSFETIRGDFLSHRPQTPVKRNTDVTLFNLIDSDVTKMTFLRHSYLNTGF